MTRADPDPDRLHQNLATARPGGQATRPTVGNSRARAAGIQLSCLAAQDARDPQIMTAALVVLSARSNQVHDVASGRL
jgi:hypothetical protein